MNTLCREWTLYLVLFFVLVIGTVCRASEILSGYAINGQSNEVQVVSRVAEERKSFADLWQQYRTATSPEYRRMLLLILVSRQSREMSPEIDRELCSKFENYADPDIALLLGMCASGSSLQLLLSHEKTTCRELSKSVRLALARRGNAAIENALLEQFARLPVGRGELVNWGTDMESRESIRNLEYVGSPRCVLALCDAAVSIQAKEMNEEPYAITSALPMIASMRDFLSRLGLSMPIRANRSEMVDWWKSNRTIIITMLSDKNGDLPRMKPIRIVLSRD